VPSFAQIRSHALCWAGASHSVTCAALRNCFVIGSYSRFGIGIAFALCCPERGGSQLVAETDSAANHYGKLRAENPRHISVFCGTYPAPRIFLRPLDGRVTMSTFDILPGELNAQIISSIINLVCPQCGGRMSEFQCEGKCRRNWIAEWEWANHVTRSPKSRRGHTGRLMR
jgi:hypothetical protein